MQQVKSPKKPLIYYYTIVIIVLLLFNLLAMPWISERQIKEVDYGTFISMTEEGKIGKVEIQQQENTILFTDEDETAVYKTAMVEDDQLTQRLYDAGISFYGEEIRQTSPVLSALLSWIIPLVIFILIGQYMSRKLTKKAG